MVDWTNMFSGIGLGSAAGSAFGNLFGGGPDTGYYDTAMNKYQSAMDRAMSFLREHEATGRGDIGRYLTEAQSFGAPYREAGGKSLSAYMGSLGLGGEGERQAAMQAFHEAPAFRYQLQQAQQNLQRQLGGAGMRGSGLEKRALMTQAQKMAESGYGDWQKQLAGLTGMGQSSAEAAAQRSYGAGGQLAQLGLGYAGQMSQLQQALAQAQAEAELAKGQQQAAGKQDWWSSLGSLGGLAAGFLL